MPILDALQKAIKNKKVIEFNYKLEWIRIWNPYAVYKHTNTWNILLDLYQTKWYSNSNDKIPWWREFEVKDINNLKILDETFNINNQYKPNSERYSNYLFKI